MPQDRYFRPRNWTKFQHYGQRNPPWIKLHKSLLRDRDFSALTPPQQLICIKIWLLYSDLGQPLVWDCPWIGRNIGHDTNLVGKALPVLLDKNFIELCTKDASKTLAPCKQSASPETETETETDNIYSPDDDFDAWYAAYPRREGRGQAIKAYRTARKKTDAETLLAGAKAASTRYATSEKRFIPMPATWLNGERWLDQVDGQKSDIDREIEDMRKMYADMGVKWDG